ncbi:MAG: T9SS type A sorting domain-containing protein [Bacteroidales bacterium]|nr:T9SS type A sorting domain-containing protein [Bacteroidales bacterium]
MDGTIRWEFYSVPDSPYNDFSGLRDQPVVTDNGSVITPIFSPAGLLKLDSGGHFQSVYPVHIPDTMIAGAVNSMELFQKNRLLIGLQNFQTGYDGLGNGVLQMTDTTGNVIRAALLPVSFPAIIYDIHETSDNKIVILASHSLNGKDFMLIKYNENLEYDSLYLNPGRYDWRCEEAVISNTIEIDCTDYGVEEIVENGVVQLQILPNPACDIALIRLPEAISTNENQGAFIINSIKQDYIRNLKIEIYDLNGKLILQSQWPDNTEDQIFNISSWNEGLYLIRITNPNEMIATGKLVIK